MWDQAYVFSGKIILPTRHLRQRGGDDRDGKYYRYLHGDRSRRGRCGVLVLDHRCAWNCNLLWRMFFVHEIPQNGKRWKEDRRSDVCVGERHAAERTCGLIFCVYDISVAWDRQQCAGTFDQCGDNGTDTGIAAYIGMAAGVLAGKVIIGGSRQIGKVCTWLVPVMSAFYLGGCIFILMKNYTVIPEAVKMIVTSAFVPEAAAGGVVGTTVMAGLRTGISRGLFTNEAGLGSIPMAAATAQHASPRDQALVSMTGPFWDTVVM